MALYIYRALNPQGKTEKGNIDASSENEAKSLLKARRLFPLEVKTSRPFSLGLRSIVSFSGEPRLSVQNLAGFCRQFGTLLEATIPYDTALEMILKQTKDASFKAVLSEVKGKVMEGAYLADAFAPYPRVFPPMVSSMVRSGETSGTLGTIMYRLADYYENLARIRARMSSAMVYPAFMMAFSTAVVVFMVTFIIPKITRLFGNFGVSLPLPTRMMIALSELTVNYWWVFLMLLLPTLWGTTRLLKTEAGRLAMDTLELKIPVWKELRRRMIVQRFTQTLATMLQSGIDLKDALQVSSQVLENKLYLRAMDRVIFDVQNKGLPLSVALEQAELFPEDLCQMIAIAEETATLDVMLDNFANRLGREVSAMMDGATALLEPVMILVMGAVVGFIVVSILLPMLQLNQLLS